MRKLFILLASLLLVACTAKPLEWNSLSILSPKGAPAVALIPLIENGTDTIELVDGADLLSAELVKGEKDVIIAPVNLGAMLASKGSSTYKLYGIVTWGNLYIVGIEGGVWLTDVRPIALFGDKAVPGVVFNKIESKLGYTVQKDFFNSVTDVQGQLLGGQYILGMLAEPAVTATIAKAKQNNLTLSVVNDVQALWKEATGFDNYPQAAIFVKSDLTEDQMKQVDARFASMLEFNTSADMDPSVVVEKITTITPEVLGVASGEIVKAAWVCLNISVTKASDQKDAIEAFLELFKLNGLEGFYVEAE
jgi:NitT/TauT family transport system substrate-binding protein